MGILLGALIIAILLIAYVKVEKRINQRPCPECGFRVSIEGVGESCPRCGALIPERDKN